MLNLHGKKVILGVSASIAVYKSLELVRLFIKSGASVRVVMSEEAKRFITPLTFESISQKTVLHKESEDWGGGINHISIKNEGDIFVIAPATANTVSKLALGICDNLLLQSAIAYDKKLLIAPSANSTMLLNSAVQENIKKLKERGTIIIEPRVALLACNEEGIGAMADVLDIYYGCAKEMLRDSFWSGKKVVITGGGTSEKIDDFRYISNASSGKTASNLALAFYLKGADVTLISSKSPLPLPSDITKIEYTNTQELKKAIDSNKGDFLVMAAAVADFISKEPAKGKIKKEDKDRVELTLVKNIDLLKECDFKGKKIGFKAESDREKGAENAKNMLKNKKLDAVCLNFIDEAFGFGGDMQEIIFIDKNSTVSLGAKPKLDAAFDIVEKIRKL